MKAKIFSAFVFVMLSMQAFANNEQQEKDVYCKEVYNTSMTIMNMRQNGTPMPQMIEWADGGTLALWMVETAFETPLYASKAFKENAVAEYSEMVYKACRKHFNGRG